ncbi:MAG: hypothetical protein COC06_12380 [Bacteroidales bacterium]|nr:MAG: hypothetical protein COC06_12380 [Bacteroidales bacterium]
MTVHKEKLRNIIDKIHPLKKECWNELEKFWSLRKINRNEYYSKEGETFKQLSFLCSGILRAYHTDDMGNEWNEHFFVKNEFVTSGVSPEIKNITNIQSLSESVILTIPIMKLIEISNRHSEINEFIQKLSFKCLENRQKREFILQSNNTINRYTFFKQTFSDVETKIQDFHIASYIGTSPTQLSRIKKKINMQLHM